MKQAVKEGYDELIPKLVEAGGSVDHVDGNFKTLLMMGSEKGNLNVVKSLVKTGADLDKKDTNNMTALMMASERGYVGVVSCLLQKEAKWSSIKNLNGESAGDLAMDNNHDEVVNLLLLFQDSGYGGGSEYKPVLVNAASRGDDGVCGLILDRGMWVDAVNNEGVSGLMAGAEAGHLTTVILFLENGADPSLRSKLGLSPLQYSLEFGHRQVAAKLINAKHRNPQDFISAVSHINDFYDYLNHELFDKNAFGDADSQLFEENYTEAEKETQKGNKSVRAEKSNEEDNADSQEDVSEDSDFDDDDVGAKPSIVETVIKLGSDKEKKKCLEVLVLADECKYGDDQPNKTELRVISSLRSVLLHPELAFVVKYVRSLSPLGPVLVLKTSALFSFQVLMGWGFYALDVGTDVKFCISMFSMKLTDNLTLADRDTFAYLGTIVNHSNPILAVENGEDFIIAGIISATHVGISVIASMVLFLSTECGHFSRESLYRLPIPFVTKTRGFYLEYQKLKILREKRSDKKTTQIRKWENRIQKHSDWINLSLMTEASFESSFQFLFQSMLAVLN